MSKLNINLKDYKEAIIIILTFIQIMVMFCYFNIKNEPEQYEEKNYSISHKLEFNEVNNSIEIDKNIDLLEIEDLDNRWYIKVRINGSKEKIEEVINKMEEIQIYSYNIVGKGDNLDVILEMYK